MHAIALMQQLGRKTPTCGPLDAAYDGDPTTKLDLSDINQKTIYDSCCADADLMYRALSGSDEHPGTDEGRYTKSFKQAACFRKGGGSTSTSTEEHETMGRDSRMWKSSKTEFDATLIKKIQCKSDFDLRIYECNGCDCSIKIEGHTKLQLVKVHTAHGLHPDSKDKACEPWFTYVDGMIRNQVSNVRREVIKATPNP